MSKSIFDEFTNLYSLSKTLRFELKPVGNTQAILEEQGVFRKDEIIHEKYIKTKPYFDQLHREFVKEALQNAVLTNLSEYFVVFKKWKIDKKANEKELQAKEKELRKEVVKFFDMQAKVWADEEKYAGLKNKDLGILDEEGVFEFLLKKRYGTEEDSFLKDEENGEFLLDEKGEKISIFDSWKGFTGYFGKFFETRKNFYKDEAQNGHGKAGQISTRVIDQNLKRFCDNIQVFEMIKEKFDFSEVERNFGKNLVEVFSVDFYNTCFLQDGIDFYNMVLGGKTLVNGEKKKGFNELINKYRQDHKGDKLPFLKTLDKQILSEKEKFIDEIENEEALFGMLKTFQKTAEEKTEILRNLFGDFVKNQEKYNLSQVYFSRESFNTISHKWTNETDIFEEVLFETLKKAKIVSSSAKKKDGGYSFPEFIALSFLKEALEKIQSDKFWKERYYENSEDSLNKGFLTGKEKKWEQFLAIFEFEFSSLFEREITTETGEKKKIGYDVFKDDFKNLLENFKVDHDAKIVIKSFADSVLNIYQMAKYFAVEKKRNWLADYELDVFYSDPENGYLHFYENAYEDIVQVYNKLRNYLTKKPYSEEKWKLNFEKSTLANGWPDSPDGNTQYCSFIFRNKQEYFLGVTDFSKIFDMEKFTEAYKNDEEGYEKMVYKQVDAKTLYGSVYCGIFGTKYSDDQEKLNDQELIQRMKKVLETREKFFPEFSKIIQKINNTKYETAKELAREISEGAFYNISFVPISSSYLYKGIYEFSKNKKGDTKMRHLYLFKIKNKDWNEGSTGTKNLHTLYFESLFSNENIAQNFPIKLNGQAEIFYRPKTEAKKLGMKKDKQGNEVINHKRYNENKVFFHVPLTLNRTKSDPFKFNAQVNNFLANNPDINVIGVDRGEKHLAYYSVISQKGKILDSGSLNFIQSKDNNGEIILKNGKKIEEIKNDKNEIVDYRIVETGEKVEAEDYKLLLEYKEKKRKVQRQTWNEVEGIKDLKKGYISQVVRKLADLAVEHNAIIVFEDLNMRFKQIRGGIEKSVYQQLEKALIEKLNFLVNKGEKDPEQAGHLLRAYQLTAPFTTFKDMGKQTGILFYTQAAYTSKIDPITGWRPHLYLKHSSAEKTKENIIKFSKIEFANERFEFTYDIKSFQLNNKEYSKNTVWTVCSGVERFRWNRHLNNNKGAYEYFDDITENLKELFTKYQIDFERGDIIGQIETLETKGNEKFFEHFIFFFNLICQIRNMDDSEKAKKDGKDDFILSPVAPFFDSRNSEKFGENLPENGDDNGAYNIARKGIVVLKKIIEFAEKNEGCEKMSWVDLYVSNTEWDDFVRGK